MPIQEIHISHKNIRIVIDQTVAGKALFYTTDTNQSVLCICFLKDITREPLLYVTEQTDSQFQFIKQQLALSNCTTSVISNSFSFIPFIEIP